MIRMRAGDCRSLGMTRGLLHAKQTLYQLSYVPIDIEENPTNQGKLVAGAI